MCTSSVARKATIAPHSGPVKACGDLWGPMGPMGPDGDIWTYGDLQEPTDVW